MSENKTEVKARIMPAEDGSIKVVFFSAPTSPPLLGAKACACARVADLHSPPNTLPILPRRQASGAKNAPVEDVTVAESGAEAPLDESILKKDLAAEEATAAETVDSDRAKAMFAAHKPRANAVFWSKFERPTDPPPARTEDAPALKPVTEDAPALEPVTAGGSPLPSIKEFPVEEPAPAGIDEWKTPSPLRKIERKGESNLIDRSKKTTKNLNPIGRVDPNEFAALLGTDVDEEDLADVGSGKASVDEKDLGSGMASSPSSTTPSARTALPVQRPCMATNPRRTVQGAVEKTEPTSTRSGFRSGKFCSTLLCVFLTVVGLGCSAFALSSYGSGGVSSELLESVFVPDVAALPVLDLTNTTPLNPTVRGPVFASVAEPPQEDGSDTDTGNEACPWQPTVAAVTHAQPEAEGFWGVWKSGADLAAYQRAKLEWHAVGFDADLAVDKIATACSGGADALVVTVPFAAGTEQYAKLDAAISDCTSRIPVITTNTDTYHNEAAYLYVGSSNYAMGQRCGRAVLGEPLDAVIGRIAESKGVIDLDGDGEIEDFEKSRHFWVYWAAEELENEGLLRRLQGLNDTLSEHGATLDLFHDQQSEKEPEMMISLSSSWVDRVPRKFSGNAFYLYVCGDDDVNQAQYAAYGQPPFLQGESAISKAILAAISEKSGIRWEATRGNPSGQGGSQSTDAGTHGADPELNEGVLGSRKRYRRRRGRRCFGEYHRRRCRVWTGPDTYKCSLYDRRDGRYRERSRAAPSWPGCWHRNESVRRALGGWRSPRRRRTAPRHQ